MGIEHQTYSIDFLKATNGEEKNVARNMLEYEAGADEKKDVAKDMLKYEAGADEKKNINKDMLQYEIGSDDKKNVAEDAWECNGCHQKTCKFACSGCYSRWYCSRECQVIDWWGDHAT